MRPPPQCPVVAQASAGAVGDPRALRGRQSVASFWRHVRELLAAIKCLKLARRMGHDADREHRQARGPSSVDRRHAKVHPLSQSGHRQY